MYMLGFFVYDITWCVNNGDYGLYFGGGSYSSVYVPPPMHIFYCPCNVCPCVICCFPYFYILYAYFFVHICPSFSFYQLWEIYPQLDENFGGVCICVLPYAATCVF